MTKKTTSKKPTKKQPADIPADVLEFAREVMQLGEEARNRAMATVQAFGRREKRGDDMSEPSWQARAWDAEERLEKLSSEIKQMKAVADLMMISADDGCFDDDTIESAAELIRSKCFKCLDLINPKKDEEQEGGQTS